MIVYWSYRFLQNQDLCRIDFRHFYQTEEDVLPVVSVCFQNPFVQDHLRQLGTNETSLINFWEGDEVNSKLAKVPFDNITLDLANYATAYWIQWKNGSDSTLPEKEMRHLVSDSYSGFWHGRFYKCFAIKMPYSTKIEHFAVRLKRQILLNGIRPQRYSFVTLIHYPSQLLRSLSTMMYAWPEWKDQSTYSMRFTIKSIEIFRQRNKISQPCIDEWRNYDNIILQNHLQKNGCKAPYQKHNASLPICKTKEKLKWSLFPLTLENVESYLQPCKTMEKVIYSYDEFDLSGTGWENTTTFFVGMYHSTTPFKEIVEERYYNTLQ